MKKLATLLIGIILSINTFSQNYKLSEIITAEDGQMTDLVKVEDSTLKGLILEVKKGTVVLNKIGSRDKFNSKEVVTIEKDTIEEHGRVIYGKNKDNKHIVISFNNNGTLFVEYGSSYKLTDTETSMIFVMI